MLARLRELNWQTSGKKTHVFERKILLSIFSICRKIINRKNSLYDRPVENAIPQTSGMVT